MLTVPETDSPRYCALVELAFERNAHDLRHGKKRGLYFCEASAQRAVDFFKFLKHSKDPFAGVPFTLEPWQEFLIRSLFGWYKPRFEWDTTKKFNWRKHPFDVDDVQKWGRRFTVAYTQVPKKSGKSTLAAAIGSYMLIGDQVQGAEVYSAAVKADQARLVHDEAKRMLNNSEELKPYIEIIKNNISMISTWSKWDLLSRNPSGNDGINPTCTLVDELHQWPETGKELLDIIIKSSATRRSPLTFIITTAGKTKESLCYQKRRYAENVLRGVYEDDSFFAFISEPTPEELEQYGFKETEVIDGRKVVLEREAWENPQLWDLVNPNLGVSIPRQRFKELYQVAKNDPVERTAFKRFHLNMWCGDEESKMLNIDLYERPVATLVPELLRGAKCYIGVDLSNRIDLTSVVALFPFHGGDYVGALPFCWVPKENVLQRVRRDNVPYDRWIMEGVLQTTDGNAVDYKGPRAKVLELCDLYDVQCVAIDPWNAGRFGQALQDDDGITVVEVRQGYASLNDGSKYLQELVLGGRFLHNHHPILRWCAGNMIARMDPNGNIAPDKKKSEEKIDAMSATITAMSQLVLNMEQDEFIYDKRGLISI